MPEYVAVAQYRRNLETCSTPFLYAGFGALASGEYAADRERWCRL